MVTTKLGDTKSYKLGLAILLIEVFLIAGYFINSKYQDYLATIYGGVKSDNYCLNGGICDDDSSDKARDIVSQALNKKYNESDFTNKTQKVDNDYAKGSAVLKKDGGQYAWIAVRQNGKWIIVDMYSDLPSCSSMSKYSVPEDFYLDCK